MQNWFGYIAKSRTCKIAMMKIISGGVHSNKTKHGHYPPKIKANRRFGISGTKDTGKYEMDYKVSD